MIRGIGGVFIYADDADVMVAWYTQHLGMKFQYEESERSHYRDFVLQLDPSYGHTEREVFAIRQAESKRADSTQRFVVNLRVEDLDALLEHLRVGGVAVERTEDFDYGRFAWIKDAEGNVLELFEPQ